MNIRRLLLIYLFLCVTSGISQSLKPDLSFAGKGKFRFSNGAYNEVKDMVASPEGSLFILVESSRFDSTGSNRDADIIVLKLSASGSPDLSFGNKGQVKFDFLGMDVSRAAEIELLPDGKLLLSGDGAKTETPKINPACIARLLPDGSPDKTFGRAGTLCANFNKVSYLSSLHVASDSSFFIAGCYSKFMGNHSDVFPVIGKLNMDGTADKTFGGTGKVSIDFNFELYSLSGLLHTAGGEIYDLLVQEDGKVIVSGGFIFQYIYEGFVARFNPDGSLDKSFNSTGYLRHNFTPGKTNFIKKIALYDASTLLLGASTLKDFDSDFYMGVLDLNTFSLKVTEIDFQGQQDILEDISVNNAEVILSGRSILPENVALFHQSDFYAIARISDLKTTPSAETFILPAAQPEETGIHCHLLQNDRLITAGFAYSPNSYVKDVVISSFRNKKAIKKKARK